MKIPPSKLPEFSKAYFDMFVKYDNGAGRVFMDRRDPQVRVVDVPVVVYGGGFSESCRVVAAVAVVFASKPPQTSAYTQVSFELPIVERAIQRPGNPSRRLGAIPGTGVAGASLPGRNRMLNPIPTQTDPNPKNV